MNKVLLCRNFLFKIIKYIIDVYYIKLAYNVYLLWYEIFYMNKHYIINQNVNIIK